MIVSYGLFYGRQPKLRVHGFTDADCASGLETHQSTSGYLFTMLEIVITWQSKKQLIVYRCSRKSEYIALILGIQEAV
jgi:hypothetical protein